MKTSKEYFTNSIMSDENIKASLEDVIEFANEHMQNLLSYEQNRNNFIEWYR